MKNNINIIDDVCLRHQSANNVFNSTKCLTYIDEFDQKLNENKKSTSIVSLTSLMDHYIEIIERKWLTNIREAYGFGKGEPIHFTKLRKISQTVSYLDENGEKQTSIGWDDKYIISRGNKLIDYDSKHFKTNVKGKDQKEFVEEYKVWKLFRKEDENGYGTLNIEQLKKFYEDMFLIIKEANFDILCTTILYDTKALHRSAAFTTQCTSPHTIAFGEHLDLLCFYLKQGFSENTSAKSLSTKLRWDGDNGFNQKNDYRLLFNKVVSLGTTHYQAETVRKCLDEIRFINKSEVGFYDSPENPKIISHIGCDIADFITYFVGKFSIKDELIKTYQIEGLNEEESIKKFYDSVTFTIGDKVFSPYDDILKEKILKKQSYTAIQIFNECHYNNW